MSRPIEAEVFGQERGDLRLRAEVLPARVLGEGGVEIEARRLPVRQQIQVHHESGGRRSRHAQRSSGIFVNYIIKLKFPKSTSWCGNPLIVIFFVLIRY